MVDDLRGKVLTTIVVVIALLFGFYLMRDRVLDARADCAARGGQVVIESNAEAQGFGHFCVLPDGTRERL